MDQALLGCGKARRRRIAEVSELRAFSAPALRDVHAMRRDRPQIRAGARHRHDLRLHDHVSHRRQALRRGGALRQHHRRARRCARRADGRQSAGGGIHRGEGRPPRRSRLRKTQRRHHAAPIPRGEGMTDMWENRCKVAVSGVGFSKVSRTADVPLAAHALTAVKEAVADSGLEVAGIDGPATHPELPATGHAEVDGISIVSVNCMMAMLKLPNLTWHIQVGSVNIGGAVQQAVNALLAGMCNYAVVWRAMHNPRGTYQNLPSGLAAGATQFTAPYGFGGPGQGMAVAYTRWLERHNQNREKMATLAVTQRCHTQHNPHARMVAYPFCLFDCDIPVQGAVAIVLTTAERARDLKPRPAYLAGYGQRLHFEEI